MSKNIPLLMVFLIMAVIMGCSSNDSPTGGGGGNVKENPSFANDIQPIFTGKCATSGCHDAATASSGLNLTAGAARTNIVNVNSVEVPSLMRAHPSDAANSYLVMKIEGQQAVGTRMPQPPRAALSADEIQNIKNWINQGAKDN